MTAATFHIWGNIIIINSHLRLVHAISGVCVAFAILCTQCFVLVIASATKCACMYACVYEESGFAIRLPL
jgi:hypothetical protein